MINIPYPDEKRLDEFFYEVKDRLLDRIKFIKASKKVSVNKKKYRVTKQIKNVLDWLEDEENLKNLILQKPDDLVKTIQYVEKIFYKAHYSKEALHKILFRVFVEYGYFPLDKLNFIQKIGLNCCPYCNRNFIYSVSKKGSVKPEIDHFYPKSLYPYLAISYFNLIPSCPTCNGFGAKEAKDTYKEHQLINPYKIKINDFSFSITPKSVDFLDVDRGKYDFDDFEISLSGKKEHLDVFKLDELYKQHKDIVLEILVKKIYYPESYIKELKNFGFTKDEIYRYLLCNFQKDKDLHKRPLSKLIKDISEELDLL